MIQRASRAKLASDLYTLTPAGPEQHELYDYLKWLVGAEHAIIGATEKGHAYREFCAVVGMLKCEAFVRLTGDNPFVDPAIIDKALCLFEKGDEYIFSRNDVAPMSGYPPGFDVEVVPTWPFLEILPHHSQEEHVTSALYERYWGQRCLGPSQAWLSFVNVTVDTPEDLARVRRIYADLGPYASYEEIVERFGFYHGKEGTVDRRSLSPHGEEPSASDETSRHAASGVVGALGVVDAATVTLV